MARLHGLQNAIDRYSKLHCRKNLHLLKMSVHQCSLHGLVPDQNVGKLLERIVGLCGFLNFDGKINLYEHEVVFEPEGTHPPWFQSCLSNP
jgi:hypothetical protein